MGVYGNNVTYSVDASTKVTGKILERSPFKLDITITSPYFGLHTIGIMRPEYRNTEDFTNDSGVHDCEVLLEELYYECKVMEDRAPEFIEALARFDGELANFDTTFSPAKSGLERLKVEQGTIESLLGGFVQGMASKFEPAYLDERVDLERQLYASIFEPLLDGEVVYQGYQQVPEYVRGMVARRGL
jgi:hypothetical protein